MRVGFDSVSRSCNFSRFHAEFKALLLKSVVAVTVVASAAALADIIPVAPIRNNALDYSFVATWGFNALENEEGGIGGPWGVLLESPENLIGINKRLTLEYQHRAQHAGEVFVSGRVVDLGEFAQPPAGVLRKGKIERFTHGDHFDVIRVLAQVRPGDTSTITTTGSHTRDGRFRGSILGIDGTAVFKDQAGRPLGGDVNGRPFVGPVVLRPGDHATTNFLPPGATSVTVTAAVGGAALPIDPIGTVTMGFIGATDGVPGLLDMGSAASLFVGEDQFFMPFLVDVATGADLYMAIDLSQWLIDPPSFSILDEFDFSSGVNELLSGVLVGSSPFGFDPVTGSFVSSAPASGRFIVAGMLDGQAAIAQIPTPGSAVLLVLGLALASCFRHRRRPLSLSLNSLAPRLSH